MPRQHSPACFVGATMLAAAGLSCAHVPPETGFPEARTLVSERTGHRIEWTREPSPEPEAQEAVGQLLARPLTPDAAAQVALLQNPELQATYEELSIAQADLIEAGLLENPVFSGTTRFPDGAASGTNAELEVAQAFLDILMMPARKRIARSQLEAASLRLAHAVFDLAAETKTAYYDLQAALQNAEALQEHSRAAAASAEFAVRLRDAGNASELELTREQARAEQTTIEARMADGEVVAARERLQRLLGLRDAPRWTVRPRLPALPETEPELGALEANAMGQRLDLDAARRSVDALDQAVALARRWRWIPFVEVGVSAEREIDGQWVTGPAVSFALPLFDRKQATLRRLNAQLRQRRRHAEALEIRIRSEVRERHEALMLARELAERYRTTLLPLRARTVSLAQRHYNYMLLGTFELLAAKREEIGAYQAYVHAVRDYWIARVRLAQAAGGSLPEPGDTAPLPPIIPDAPASQPSSHQGHESAQSASEPTSQPAPQGRHHHGG